MPGKSAKSSATTTGRKKVHKSLDAGEMAGGSLQSRVMVRIILPSHWGIEC